MAQIFCVNLHIKFWVSDCVCVCVCVCVLGRRGGGGGGGVKYTCHQNFNLLIHHCAVQTTTVYVCTQELFLKQTTYIGVTY